MTDPLVDQEGRTITAARLMASWRLVLLSGPNGFVYVQIGDYVVYLSSFRVMCEMVDAVREMRGVQVVCE